MAIGMASCSLMLPHTAFGSSGGEGGSSSSEACGSAAVPGSKGTEATSSVALASGSGQGFVVVSEVFSPCMGWPLPTASWPTCSPTISARSAQDPAGSGRSLPPTAGDNGRHKHSGCVLSLLLLLFLTLTPSMSWSCPCFFRRPCHCPCPCPCRFDLVGACGR